MDPKQSFARLVALPDEKLDLARAALLVARQEYPALDVDHYLARLDDWGVLVSRQIPAGASPEAVIEALNRLLFEQQGFRGNTKDYYDPRNSFLNEVLDRRTGIPITLSAVYMEVARRAGVLTAGVGLPGHFVVRVAHAGDERLVDPFHEGALLSEAECQARLDRIYDGKLKLEAAMLAACSRKSMLQRLLRNLKAIYVRGADHPRALRTVELLLLLEPDAAEDLRDRGLLHAALDCYGWAARDLRAYLEQAPGGPETDEVRKQLQELETKASHLN